MIGSKRPEFTILYSGHRFVMFLHHDVIGMLYYAASDDLGRLIKLAEAGNLTFTSRMSE